MLTITQRDLLAVEPTAHPESMNVVLHPHQLKGSAQLDFLCRSRFRGGILADGMGAGKTLTAIHAMFMVKDQPGFSLVVAPKTSCLQWKAEIENAWQEVRLLCFLRWEAGQSRLTRLGVWHAHLHSRGQFDDSF